MIIPALDLMNGNIVRLYQGYYHKQFNYHDNPITCLKNYFKQGAEIVHLVDLNGAKNPDNRQIQLLQQLLNINTQKKIQIGGGIRHTRDIKELLQMGAKRVVFSSQSINNTYMTKKWFKYFGPESLVLALDIRIDNQGIEKIAIHGWQKNTHFSLKNIIEEYDSVGLKHILCTDISKDGTLKGSNISLYQTISKKWPKISFQASGGVNSLNEIITLKHTGIKNIIIGRAFLEKKITIPEAISCWQNESSHV